jgi:hypothetical protein
MQPAALLTGVGCARAQAEPIDVLQNRREYFVELQGLLF